MALLASEITTRAAEVYLNDRSRNRYTDAVLLPVLKDAWDKLNTDLLVEGIRLLDEESASIPVNAGVTVLPLPADFVYPIRLYEKPRNALSQDYVELKEEFWNPIGEGADSAINAWAWREDAVILRVATTDRDLLLHYKKSLVPVTAVNTDLAVLPVLYRAFLSAKVAALAAMFDGEDSSRAAAAEGVAEQELEKIKGIYTKKAQTLGVRRQPFDGRRY